jgi:hypothetical protein
MPMRGLKVSGRSFLSPIPTKPSAPASEEQVERVQLPASQPTRQATTCRPPLNAPRHSQTPTRHSRTPTRLPHERAPPQQPAQPQAAHHPQQRGGAPGRGDGGEQLHSHRRAQVHAGGCQRDAAGALRGGDPLGQHCRTGSREGGSALEGRMGRWQQSTAGQTWTGGALQKGSAGRQHCNT